MERNNYISEVITLFLHHRYGQETEEKVQRWLISETHQAEKNRVLESWWNTLPQSASPQACASLAQVKARLGMDGARMEISGGLSSRRMWLRVAAALLPLFILAGSYFLLKNALEERDVAVNISVPYGENREVKLSDGSVVFLNAGSNLQYTVASGKTVRDVILNGEAYFSIAKDASRPFTVRTEHLSIEVPGTEFNVKAYPDETKTTATLNSGRIKAETDGGQAYVLNPGGQLSYSSRSKSATLSHVDATDFSAWKDGRLIFNDTPLHEIIAAIERKFDVRFAPDSSIDLDDRYSVKFIHGEDLPRIMKIMETVCGFNCHTEGKTILLTKTETKT